MAYTIVSATSDMITDMYQINTDEVNAAKNRNDITTPNETLEKFTAIVNSGTESLVAVEDGNVIGFMIIDRENKQNTDTGVNLNIGYKWFDDNLTDFFYLERCVIHADHRHRGITDAFVEEARSRAAAANVSKLVGEVVIAPKVSSALAYWESKGFTEVGRVTYNQADRAAGSQFDVVYWLGGQDV